MLFRWEKVANYRHTFQNLFSCTIKIGRKSDLNSKETIKELIMQVRLTTNQSLRFTSLLSIQVTLDNIQVRIQ